tara:strand:- start:5840 stop:7027 length:1188 start_codon:yes stop_codon:yes gene_type:complete
MNKFKENSKLKLSLMLFIAIGVIALIMGFADSHHTRIWTSLLFNNLFFTGIALFGVFFVALQYVSQAGWSTVFKRIPEAVSSYLPLGGGIMLLVVLAGAFDLHHIYHWMDPELHDKNSSHYDKVIAGKSGYLNIPFFLIRSFIYVFVWVYCSRKLKEFSLKEDLDSNIKWHNKSVTLSAVFIVFYAVSTSIAAWDWIMSIDAHWYSTMFGWYFFSGTAASGFTVITLLIIYLKKQGYLPEINQNHLHDLGKFIFVCSILWTYLWFSQFMLIWYAHIPEEILYFIERFENYKFILWMTLILNFAFPTLLLMSRDCKRNYKYLIVTGVIVLIGHWLDYFLMVTPGVMHSHWHLGFIEVGVGIGCLGIFTYLIFNRLKKVNLIVKNHPFLDESKHHEI